jgi:hypothetical protein
MKPPLLALFTLAFIRVIRGLNVFGCGGAALGDRQLIADPGFVPQSRDYGGDETA